MPRQNRPLDRTSGAPRDANIIVIACEDTHAVKQYFAKFRTKRTQYKVLPTLDGNSLPRAVLDRLNTYKNEYATEDGDELWICIDADHWIRGGHQAEFSQVLQECHSKGYGIAISNPCFEVWLLMHFVEIDGAELSRILKKNASEAITGDDKESIRCDKIEARLRKCAGGYNKSNVAGLLLTTEQVLNAIARARAADGKGSVPGCPGTRVYLLVEKLQSRGSIELT